MGKKGRTESAESEKHCQEVRERVLDDVFASSGTNLASLFANAVSGGKNTTKSGASRAGTKCIDFFVTAPNF